MDRKILEGLIAKKGVQKLAHELGVSKRRVREVRQRAEVAGYSSGLVCVPEFPLALFPDLPDRRQSRSSDPDMALNNQKTWIEESLRSGWKPISVFEELKIPGISRSSFYRFLDRHKLDELADQVQKESFIPPIIHKPGEALQLDWGKIRDITDPKTGKTRTLWGFVGVLGFSRYMMVKLVWSNSVEITLDCIAKMFAELGGVPTKITSDNPKCFSLEADFYEPLLNPAFIRFANHYRFTIECLPPRDPKKKGKVERLMPFARRLFEVYPSNWDSMEHAQEFLEGKLKIANQRIHGTTRLKPIIVFLEKEAQTLRSLPPLEYELEEVSYPKVRRDGFIRFGSKFYAIGEGHTGKTATVLATRKIVTIYLNGKLQETYTRITDPYETHSIKEHLQKPWQKVETNNAFYLQKARRIGPNVEELILKILQRGNGFVDTRVIWGVLSLDKKFINSKIDECAKDALDIGTLSYRHIKALLNLMHGAKIESDQTRESPKAIEVSLEPQSTQTSKFIRSVSVYSQHIKTVH